MGRFWGVTCHVPPSSVWWPLLLSPTVFAGVVVRNDANALVAFHAITIQFGANFGRVSMRP